MRDFLVKKRRTNGERAAVFLICVLSTVLIGFVSGFLSGVFKLNPMIAAAPYSVRGSFMLIVYAAVFCLTGSNLYLTLVTETVTRTNYFIRMWCIILWCMQFIMLILFSFFFYYMQRFTLSYVWAAVLCAAAASLVVLSFRLNFLGGLVNLPCLAWLLFTCYTTLYALINI